MTPILKNLFTYLHEEGGNEIDVAVYENPYETNHVPDDLAAQMRITPPDEQETTSEQDAERRALRKKYTILSLVCIGVAVALPLVCHMMLPPAFSQANGWLYLVLALIPLGGYWYFTYKARRQMGNIHMSDLEKIDFDAYAERVDKAYKEALTLMGVPDNTVTIEILPYPYVMKKGKAVYGGRKNTFDNTPMEFFVKEGRLCITDGEALFEIPLSDVVGYRTYDVDYRIEFWLKEEAHDSETYADFNIRKSGLFEYKTHTYHGVEIQDGSTGQGYEMLVPRYDFEKLKSLMDLTQLDS